MNVAKLLVRAGHAYAERPAIYLGTTRHITYRDLAERVACMANGLRHAMALEPGDRVALVMRNSPQYVELLFACWHAGLVAVPINAKLHPREFAYILNHSGARACFASPELHDVITPLQLDQPIRVVSVAGADYDALAAHEPAPVASSAVTDTAWLFYTSGTTGKPKGAMLSHRNLLTMTLCYFADVDQVEPGDCILHAAPMSHGSGMYILPHVAQGAAQVIPPSGGFDEDEVLAMIKAHPGLSMFAAPTMVKRLAEHPASRRADTANLKTIIYGGGPMYLADLERAHQVFGYKLAQIYGQGESPMTITALNKARHADTQHPRYRQRLASVGVAQTEVEVRIVDVDDNPLESDEVGEVLVRGDSVMSGYWRDREATARAVRDGWLYTGDMGSMDADGFLTLSDRSKDLIISGGSNIYPREVEEVLLQHPAVSETSVVGKPDPEWGEVVVAFVVASEAPLADSATLDSHCLEHLARFKRPKEYRFVEALPKNNYGKVLKTELRKLVGE